jgi:hypothetical protein
MANYESRYKTLRHIETVRNYLDQCIHELINRAQKHDQSKLEDPEVEIFDQFTPKLRDCTYGSEEYRGYMKEMQVAIRHHNENNRHHPEHFKDEMLGMNLIDLLEMLVDWYASGKRHNDGDIYKSIEINAKRFSIPEPLVKILYNTANWIIEQKVYHKAEES